MVDRSRWHYCRKPWLDQCRFGWPGPYLVVVSRHPHLVHSNSWCRNDWAHMGGLWADRSKALREQFRQPCVYTCDDQG